MSRAVWETVVVVVVVFPLDGPAAGDVGPDSVSDVIEMLLQSDGVGDACLGSVTVIP